MSDSDRAGFVLEPHAVSPREAAILENTSVSVIYVRMTAGEYPGVYKDGRSTRIPLKSIRDRRARLPDWHSARGPVPGTKAR